MEKKLFFVYTLFSHLSNKPDEGYGVRVTLTQTCVMFFVEDKKALSKLRHYVTGGGVEIVRVDAGAILQIAQG